MACNVGRWERLPDSGWLDAHTNMGKLQSKFRRRSDLYKWDMMRSDDLTDGCDEFMVIEAVLLLLPWQGQRGGGYCTRAPGSAVWTRSHGCHQLCRQPDLWPVRVRGAWPGELEKHWIGGRFGCQRWSNCCSIQWKCKSNWPFTALPCRLMFLTDNKVVEIEWKAFYL